MPARRFVARPPGSQKPRHRRRGRLSPTNGSVTRADVDAIYAEFERLGGGTSDDFRVYLLGAIVDWDPSPRQRARMSRAAQRRERERRAREQLAQPPSRTLAAA